LERVKNINNYEAHNRAIREMTLIQHRDSMEGLAQTKELHDKAMIKMGAKITLCLLKNWFTVGDPDGEGYYNQFIHDRYIPDENGGGFNEQFDIVMNILFKKNTYKLQSQDVDDPFESVVHKVLTDNGY
jgi:hypothetical protein